MTIWSIIPFIACLAYIALLVLTLTSVERRTKGLFASYLVIAAAWSLISFLLHLNVFPQQALLWNKLMVIASVWTLITYYHFIRTYTNTPAGTGLYLGYALLLVLAVLSFSGHIVQSAHVVDGVLYHDPGTSIYFISAASLTLVGAGAYLLVKRHLSYTNPVERNRTMYLIAGWSLLMLISYSNLTPPLARIPLDHIGNVANALIIAYAIRKQRPLNIKLVVLKGLVYSSLTIFLTALYFLSLFILQIFFQGWTGYNSLALATGFAFLVAVLFNPIKNFIQRSIDRIFYLETHDYRQMLPNLSKKVSNVLDLGELSKSILDPIVKALHIKQAALLFPEIESTKFNTRFVQQVTKEEPFTRLKFANDSPIVTWLVNEGKPLRRESIDFIPQFKGLWEVERIALNALRVELLCPIRSKGHLIGILALGEKQSDSLYSDEEVDLLMTTANKAAIAVENARMIDILKNQQLQVEQLLAQMALAQEEEPERTSTSTDDSITQWLAEDPHHAQVSKPALPEGNGDNARSELAEIESVFNKSLKALRRVMNGHRLPTSNGHGLAQTLWQSLEDLKADGLDCKFSEEGMPLRLPSKVEIAVHHVVQEAITNIRKHANASQVNLRLQFKEDKLLVEISDNGKGFDLSQALDNARAAGHGGLLDMKQRAEMAGGNVRIKTGEGKGTTITLSLPIQP